MIISVIIPTYKPGAYFEECLESIAKQTLDSEKFEVLIILNGCDEPWHSQIASLIKMYLPNHNVSLIQTDAPGVSNARNIGIDNAKGEYIAFIDDDDYISPSYLLSLLEASTPESVALTDSVYFDDETGQKNYDNIHHNEYVKLKDSRNPSLYKARRFFNGPVMKLVHIDIIGSRRFDIRFANGEDSLFMALISDKIKKCKFCSSYAVYYRRVRTNSATTRKRSFANRFGNGIKAISQYLKYWVKRPLSYNAAFMTSRIMAQFKNLIVR